MVEDFAVSELEDLRAKKQEIKERRSVVLAVLGKANLELGEITDEFLAVDLQINLAEKRENDHNTS